jgi:cell division protein FtsA
MKDEGFSILDVRLNLSLIVNRQSSIVNRLHPSSLILHPSSFNRESLLARNDLVAGLDIGTTKTCCVVAELGESGEIIVSGVGISPSGGLKRGVVVDIDATVRAVEDAVVKASRQAGREVTSVYVGVTGEHIKSLNSKGVTAITHPDREIHEDDVERALEQSRVIVIPPDREILHAIPRSYSIDGQNGIKHPVGMSGTRLEVETHIVHGSRTFIDNVSKCVTRAGLALDDMVLEPLATSESVLLPAEKNLGVCLVDIGGGTSDLAIFLGGEIYYSAVVPVGGNHVTNDLAQLLRVTTEEAERVKIEHGSALVTGIGEEDSVSITQIGSGQPRPLRRRAICEIIEARMQELFQLVLNEIKKSGCHQMLPAGLVLSGGGSQLRATAECASQVLEMPVRLGKPTGVAGLGDTVNSPIFATAVGLVQYGAHQLHTNRHQDRSGSPFAGLIRFFSRLIAQFRAD